MRAALRRALAWIVRRRFPRVRPIPVEGLAAWLDSAEAPPLLLDARSAEEYAVSHLAGARLAPDPDRAVALLERLGVPREAPVVAYCSVGWRSARLADALRERGFRDVRNLEGSLFAWVARGLPVERDGREVAEVHPFGAPWSALLAPALRARHPRASSERSA